MGTNDLALDPSVSRLRSHFRTPSTTTVNSIHHSAGISPALNSTLEPEGWNSPSRLSALSRVSSFTGHQPHRVDVPADPSEVGNDNGSVNNANQFDSHPAGEVTGFLFHTMKDCTKLLFQQEDQFPSSDTASPIPKSGFMRRLSSATESEDAGQFNQRQWGLPTVIAVNDLIAVGTESGWVAIMNFKQELQRVCGTDATGKALAKLNSLKGRPNSSSCQLKLRVP